MVIVLVWVYFFYEMFATFSPDYSKYISWTVLLLFYMWITVNFFVVYLDTIVFTKSSVIIFKVHGMFNSTSDNIAYESIESIFMEQDWIVDIILNKWNIIIRRQWHVNTFTDVENPSKEVSEIDRIIDEKKQDRLTVKKEKPKDDNFSVFVEAMWEIMKEYKSKN